MTGEPGNSEKFIKAAIWIGIVAACVFIILGFLAWGVGHRVFFKEPNPSLSDWGNYGSYLQGTTALFWSLAGFFIILVAFLAQKQQLLRQDMAMEDQRRQFQLQHDILKRQNFENSFFQLLNLHHEVSSTLRTKSSAIQVGHTALDKVTYTTTIIEGRACFEKWHSLLKAAY